MGKARSDAENPFFLPIVVHKIQQRREELGEGQWLSEELRVALTEMAPILEQAQVTFEAVSGRNRSIVISAVGPGGGPSSDIEAYSIKMMANCLKNAGSMFLSRALEPECAEARQRLIHNLTEIYRLLMDREAQASSTKEGRGAAHKAEGRAMDSASWEHQRDERKANLLASVLETTTAAAFRDQNEEAFQRIFDSIWQQVNGDSLPETIAASKILDHIYAERGAKSSVAKEGVPAPAQEPSPAVEAVQLPAILDNWVGQGLTAHRIFRDLQKTSDIKTQVNLWAKISTKRRTDVEYLFILHVLNSVARFEADGETVGFPVPQIPKMGFAEFEKLVEEGKATGVENIDPRIWGVIGGVYSFLKNWLGPQLQQP